MKNVIHTLVLQGNENAELDSNSVKITEEEQGSVSSVFAVYTNKSASTARLSRLDVGCLLKSTAVKINYFTSGWGTEFTPATAVVDDANKTFSFGSESGRSGNAFVPFVGIQADDEFYAMAIGWSGSWNCSVTNTDSGIKITMGISSKDFFVDLKEDESFTSAKIYIAKANTYEDACANLRKYFRKYLSIIDDIKSESLPMTYNTWWAFEDKLIDEEVYIKNAKIAGEVGCTYAIMDAGWFGAEDQGEEWFHKRGDWDVVNIKRFPSGMKNLCDKAKRVNVLPGIWCEIEAVGKDATLHERMPEIIAKRDGIELGYVCFGSEKTVVWAKEVIDKIIAEYGAKYIKLDYNLDPAPGCNASGHNHGEGDGLYKHIVAYYQFLDDIRSKYPDVVIENCSSGGQRMDIEMASHTHVSYLSDPDYTELHLQCFWGALSYLHQSACLHTSWSAILGDHNLDVKNPITANITKAEFDFFIRAAMLGVPCLSYDLASFSDNCKAWIKEAHEWYSTISAQFILNGDAYRLTKQPLSHGLGERYPAFQFNNNGCDAIIYAFRLTSANESQIVFPKMLKDGEYLVTYMDAKTQYTATGKALMSEGIKFTNMAHNTSEIVSITKC